MKRVTLISLFLFCATIVVSQNTFSVQGTVFAANGIVAKNAEITVPHQKTETDAAGNFMLTNVKEGVLHLSVFLTGYKNYNQQINISSDTTLLIQLDSLGNNLNEVIVEAEKDNAFGIGKLMNVEGTSIYAGKKSEVVILSDINANLATNNSRQIFAKVAGINIFENDGAGIQLGIGGRGLNPNRVSNFNTRQNGYDISADALGYPESYYTPPTEALDRIEVIRGAASLQYGTQFGGFINFKFRKPPVDKKIQLTSRQTYGSFNLINSFNSLGGTIKKFSYYTFYQYKQGDSWRPNSAFKMHTAHAALNYQVNSNVKISGEYTYMTYLAQQPGGLTDKQFEKDPMQSIRNRNWFKVNWNLASLSLDWKLSPTTRINWMNFGLIAERITVGYLGQINRADPLTERDILGDQYKNFGSELRLLQRYQLFKNTSTFLIGGRYYQGQTIRKQGLGDTTSLAHFDYTNPTNLEHSDYTFPSRNIAAFSENIFQLSSKFSVTPGVRFEYISTSAAGYYRETNRDLAGNIILDQIHQESLNSTRSFVLGGLGLLYKPVGKIELYANFSQNYRSINFNDMRVINPNSRVDPNLKDETGYTTDGGVRVTLKNLLYVDFSVYYLRYNDRIGSVLQVDESTFVLYRYRTNISDSRNIGAECFAELDLIKLFKRNSKHQLSIFVNASYTDARYISSQQSGFDNKLVELVPQTILRSGITYKYKKFSTTVQGSYTAEQFADASNSKFSTNAITGIIPAYTICDFSAQYTFKMLNLSAGVNNFTNEIYFTRRAEGYPGPGILPSDPINFYVTLQLKL
ncbi:MAG: TonB-dependent receptor [Bacteroidota bacterium]